MPCAEQGDYVLAGQLIGKAGAPVSAPIHASISGAEKLLVRAHTKRVVPLVGVLVMNVSSVAFMGRYLRTGMPLVTFGHCKQSFDYHGEPSCAAACLLCGGQKQCAAACIGCGLCIEKCPTGSLIMS